MGEASLVLTSENFLWHEAVRGEWNTIQLQTARSGPGYSSSVFGKSEDRK